MRAGLVKVWDFPVRFFHWAIVILVVFQFTTAEFSVLDWHIVGGCTVLALLLFRVLWGFVGSSTARFAGFVRGPGEAVRHLARFRSETTERVLGHTASGGWAVLILLLLLAGQVGTGLFADDDIATQGPLGQFVSHATRKQLTAIHAKLFWVLLAMICVHVLAIAAYRVVKRQNLLWPMFTGYADPVPGVAPPRIARWWLAAGLLVVCGGVAWKIWSMNDNL